MLPRAADRWTTIELSFLFGLFVSATSEHFAPAIRGVAARRYCFDCCPDALVTQTDARAAAYLAKLARRGARHLGSYLVMTCEPCCADEAKERAEKLAARKTAAEAAAAAQGAQAADALETAEEDEEDEQADDEPGGAVGVDDEEDDDSGGASDAADDDDDDDDGDASDAEDDDEESDEGDESDDGDFT